MFFSVLFISVDLLILCKRQICKVRDSNPRNLLQL